MSDIKINNITDRSGSSGPVFAGISTVSTSAFMVMPSGDTEYRGGRGRGVFHGGGNNPTGLITMDYVEIATTGNATDFGDLSLLEIMVMEELEMFKFNKRIVCWRYDGILHNNTYFIDYVIISHLGGSK